MERQDMNRREFLLVAGGAAATLSLTGLLAGCGSSTTDTTNEDFVVTSSPDIHTHNITVKEADMAASAQVVYQSSITASHGHTVTITPAQINDINGGKDVNITSSVHFGHSHEFVIKRP